MKNAGQIALLAGAVAAIATVASAQVASSGPQVSVGPLMFTHSVNEAAAGATVEGTTLTLKAAGKTDNFRDPSGSAPSRNAPILLMDVDNRKPFTFTGIVTPGNVATYDAGAFFVWVREDRWLKLAMEQDERGLTRIVTVRTEGTSDDNNHDPVTAKSVHLKISSDTKTIGFYYSTDGQRWQLVRLFRNAYPTSLRLGLSAQSPTGTGTSVAFRELKLDRRSVVNFRTGE